MKILSLSYRSKLSLFTQYSKRFLVSVLSQVWDYLFKRFSSEVWEEVMSSSKTASKTEGLIFTFLLLLNGWETKLLASSGSSKEISSLPFPCDGKMTVLCNVELLVTCITQKSVIKVPIHIPRSYVWQNKTGST